MNSAELHHALILGEIALSPVVFLALFALSAGYGKLREPGRFDLPARLAWFLMEVPTIVVFLPVYFAGPHALEPIPLIGMLAFQAHYVNRTIVFPLRMRPGRGGAAWWVVALAFGYQSVNSWLIATWLSTLGDYSGGSVLDPRLLFGLAVMALGAWINVDSDRILRRLRAPGEQGYKIPHGGLYRWVSSPNYFGEAIEWAGYAVATWSPAAAAFALFTVANLGPRAWTVHQWYRERFPDYPPERRAFLPFVI